jgi:hydrogenase expression/formation protein HypC
MCLGIPSKVLGLEKNPLGMTMGEVEAGGVVRRVCMDYVPDAQVDDYVMVHMGFAVSVLSDRQADGVLDALDQILDLSPLRRGPGAGRGG